MLPLRIQRWRQQQQGASGVSSRSFTHIAHSIGCCGTAMAGEMEGGRPGAVAPPRSLCLPPVLVKCMPPLAGLAFPVLVGWRRRYGRGRRNTFALCSHSPQTESCPVTVCHVRVVKLWQEVRNMAVSWRLRRAWRSGGHVGCADSR
jgi:hypothetical protein